MFFPLVCFVLIFVPGSNSDNILVVNPSPSYSHNAAFFHFLKQLSLRGHKVTSITAFPINNPALTNLTEISVHQESAQVHRLLNVSRAFSAAGPWNIFELLWGASLLSSEVTLSSPSIQKLIVEPQQFDVVIVKYYYPGYLAFGKLYNCPTILISSYYYEEYFHYLIGNPVHPISHPNMLLPFTEPANFKDRIFSVAHSVYRWYILIYKILPKTEEIMNKYFNISVSIQDLIRDVDMVFVNTHPALHEVRSLGPTTINIGHHRQSTSSIPIQTDLKKFMDEAKDGFVYFSLGSNVNSKDLNKDTLRTLMQAIGEIPLKFLYKYEGDHLENKPDNVQIIKWAPQNDILNHPNVKLFITQGGFQSMEEAIYSAVPMVVIPFFVDQYHNAKLIEKKGIGRMVSRTPLKREELVKTISEVLNDPSYKERVIRLRQLALDVPMTGLEKAIWWIEYVIRNKGAKHLRNPAADTPVYQYFLLDVVGFLLLIIFVIIFVLYLLSKKLFAIITSKSMKYKKE